MGKIDKKDGTTQQQKLFAYEYYKNKGNAKQAAITAGYSAKTATQTASRLLTYVNVQNILLKLNAKLVNKLEDEAIFTKEQVLKEYGHTAFFDIRELYDENNSLKLVKDFSKAAAHAVAGIDVFEEFENIVDDVTGLRTRVHIGNTVKIKLNSKLAALDSIRDTMGWKGVTKVATTDSKGDDLPTAPQVVIYNNAPPMAESEADIDKTKG